MFNDWKEFKMMMLKEHFICPMCFSDDVYYYHEVHIGYDKNFEEVDRRGQDYSYFRCNKCGWENC